MRIAGLIAGLGNPGSKYERTRHNFGFMTVDALADNRFSLSGVTCSPEKTHKKYDLWKFSTMPGAAPWLLIKPLTYMNLSGEAVGAVCRYYDIDPDRVLAVHDELDLPFGRLKFKNGGGTAGHNGLKSMAAHLGTKDFPRLRLGIGRPEHGDVSSYVLGKFPGEQVKYLPEVLEYACRGVLRFMESGVDEAMQDLNGVSVVPESKTSMD